MFQPGVLVAHFYQLNLAKALVSAIKLQVGFDDVDHIIKGLMALTSA